MTSASSRNKPLKLRDQEAENTLLTLIGKTGINYAVLQTDWSDSGHGDVDLVVDSSDWARLTDILLDFSATRDCPVVKAYEIEHGVICVVMLTDNGTVFLDIAIAGARKSLFGLDTHAALRGARLHSGVRVVTDLDYEIYKSIKQRFKSSIWRRLTRKIRNIPLIIRRIIECSIVIRGAAIYIPYVLDTVILRSEPVTRHSRKYLASRLRNKYLQT